MKYGMRERVCGIVILVALAVIFLPLLFSKPAPRGEGPEPVLTVEQPIELPQNNVSSPVSPLPADSSGTDSDMGSASEMTQTSQLLPSQSESAQVPGPSPSSTASVSRSTSSSHTEPSQPEDPIMAAASHNAAVSQGGSVQASSRNGEWAVQAGSFGEAGNADRLIAQLKEQGFSAYKKPRGNLTTVYVGPFDTSGEGERARAQLQQKANIKGLVVRRKDNE